MKPEVIYLNPIEYYNLAVKRGYIPLGPGDTVSKRPIPPEIK